MEVVLFNDYSSVVFAIITSALALTWSVVGLTIPRRMRSDIKRELRESLKDPRSVVSDDRSEWKLLQSQFDALVRDRPDNIDDILDAQFCGRLGQLIVQAMARVPRQQFFGAS